MGSRSTMLIVAAGTIVEHRISKPQSPKTLGAWIRQASAARWSCRKTISNSHYVAVRVGTQWHIIDDIELASLRRFKRDQRDAVEMYLLAKQRTP